MIETFILYPALGLLILSVLWLLYHDSNKKFNSKFWIISWIRWRFCVLKTKFSQRSRRKRINNYGKNKNAYSYCGIVPTPSEIEIEKPKLLVTDRHEDGMFFWGGDQDGRSVAAKVVRLSRRRASVSLMVRDPNGQIYTLPNQPDSNFVNIANEFSWKGHGILMECLEPMRSWRFKYNGLLRCNPRETYKTEEDDEESDSQLIIHAKIDFLWKALKAPVDVWRDHSPNLIADALTREGTYSFSSIKSLDRDGYDQCGVFHGTVQLERDPPQTWYLRGIRQHRWGMSDSCTNLRRSINLYSYFSSGDILWVEGFSYRDLISHCVMGYVLTANGSCHPISWTNLEMSTVSEDEDPKNIFVQLKAGGKDYNVWHHLLRGMTVYSGDPWTLKHNICASHTAATNRDGWGLVTCTTRFKGLCPVPERRIFTALTKPIKNSDESVVLNFNDQQSKSPLVSGGKGTSLSCLTQLLEKELKDEFEVPKGIIVTSAAWTKQQEANAELKASLARLERAISSTIASKIKEECQKTIDVIEAMQINKEIATSVKEALEKTFGSESLISKRLAVRSSACGEDSEEASTAGQNATFLGVSWTDEALQSQQNVLKALLLCWASQFAYQSVEYRRQRGQPLNEGMAVVIQEMVEADYAGVIFTLDPLTGSPQSITITCNYGLGESVVSASAEPDTYIVKRSWRNHLKISHKTIGDKKIKTVMKENGGTCDVAVDAPEQESFCIGDALILRLSKLAIEVEEAFGSPRDIEFAVKQEKVYLLQSRPVTSLNEWTDYEVLHEGDTAVLSDKEIYTIHNIGEVIPGYIPPLTQSAVLKLLDLGVQKDFYKRLWPSYRYEPHNIRNFASIESHSFLNLGEGYYRTVPEENINAIINVVDLSIGGCLFTTKEIHKWVLSRFQSHSTFRQVYRIGYTIYELFIKPRRLKKLASSYSSLQIVKERNNASKALYNEICRKFPKLLKICEEHILTSSASSMSQVTACIILTENKEVTNEIIIQDMASLLSCFGDTESGDVPNAIKELAKSLSSTEEFKDFLAMTPDEGKVWLESHPGEVGRLFADFTKKHGHRAYKEFDLRTLSWGLAPQNLIEVLQKMAPVASSFKDKKAASLHEVLDSITTPIKPSTKKALRFILKICGGAVRNRETTKSLLIRTIDAFRRAYRKLGHFMVSECRLPEADLIFYLTQYEIGLLLESRSASLISKAVKRRRIAEKCEKTSRNYPDICLGIPKQIDANNFIRNDEDETGLHQLKGTPVCLGEVRGLARVVNNIQETSLIKKGDILVTYSTDIGWTPYFPLLSGVITEIGGIISHGAVVAREYGLPCVIGVKGATQLIKSGEEIILNGVEGKITLLK